jgi:hypothetical protein
VQDFLVSVGIVSIYDVTFIFFFRLFGSKNVQLSLVGVLVVDSKTLGVETILNRKKVSTVIDVVRWIVEIWSTFDSTISDI